MSNSEILADIQRDVYHLVLRDQGNKDIFSFERKGIFSFEKKGCNKSEYSDFVGFVIRKHGINGDLGFVLKKLLNWGNKCLVQDKDGDDPSTTGSYVVSLEYNAEETVVHVILNKEKLSANLIKSYWMENDGKVDMGGIDKSDASKKLFHCDLQGNRKSLDNIRTSLNAVFASRLCAMYEDSSPHVLCHDEETSSLQEMSLETVTKLHQELSMILEDDNKKADEDDTSFGLNKLKETCSGFLYRKDEKLLFNAKNYLADSESLMKGKYAKDIDTILVLDEKDRCSQFLKDATVFQRYLQLHQPYQITYFGSKRRLYPIQKTALFSELLSQSQTKGFFVFDEKQGSEIEPFLKSRREELYSSYQSRFGNVVKGKEWDEVIQKVTVSSLIMDVMTLSQNNNLKLDSVQDVPYLSSRKSLFILYNYVRLCKLKQQFDDNVKDGTYLPLSGLENTSFSHLSEHSEWKLIVQYLLLYPNVLKQVYTTFNKGGQVSLPVNQICQFLCDLCHDFSSYYHQTKILLDPQAHLAPLMCARLHLALALKRIMDHCFFLLGVSPPTEM